ncbi:hypothetical protein AUP07_1494 [methanogenic archaeon mixed culture ISO4-G1]|nr:hypothetical protein AUP07_1494 [methanogenic archaeon mixed culture ISO4-G1]
MCLVVRMMTLYDDLWTTEGNHRMNVEEEGRRRYEEGILEGREEEKRRIASEMLKRDFDPNLIAECTGLSSETVERLRTDMEQND